MKTITDYQKLKTELETIKSNNKEEYLDASFISVRAKGMNWRDAKKIGMVKKKNGWYFYSTYTNSNGYDLYEKIKQACGCFNLCVSERQL